jgi:N-methylhydantoinase A
MGFRFATDTGGTFTDLIVEDVGESLSMYKATTTPSDPVKGVLDALDMAARDRGISLKRLLRDGELFIHGTTHAINAIVTGNTARTAFLTTEGHPDVLTIREGGRAEPFNYTIPYPKPYVSRLLTCEIPERIGYDGRVIRPLDEQHVVEILRRLREMKIEAVAVCLLWSVANAAHEERIGELIEKHLPDIPYTLSHRLNPCVREYRRGSSAAIDASLKPLMTRYLGGLTRRLSDAGFDGRVLVLTSQGGAIEAQHLADNPIHAVNSGPSMAPLGGLYVTRSEGLSGDAIIADTGGTTYDVSLIRDGVIPWSPETWIGPKFQGHMTGFPSIDVRSVGAGGGSIAWVDEGGMLHMGPKSAGSVPGPVCYGNGGHEPTFTDACLVLGYLDSRHFLGGAQQLHLDLAREAIQTRVADVLGLTLHRAAYAMVDVITENMVQAIHEITINQGVDPAQAVLVGGGGAAGFNSVWVARRLGCSTLVLPALSAALSASGALISDLTADYRSTFVTTSERFDYAGVERVLGQLKARCLAYRDAQAATSLGHYISFATEARYENQVWEIEVPVPLEGIGNSRALEDFLQLFHATYKRIYAVNDVGGNIEFVNWIAKINCQLREHPVLPHLVEKSAPVDYTAARHAYFPEADAMIDADLHDLGSMKVDVEHHGPAVVESPFTTTVIPERSRFRKTSGGNLIIQLDNRD